MTWSLWGVISEALLFSDPLMGGNRAFRELKEVFMKNICGVNFYERKDAEFFIWESFAGKELTEEEMCIFRTSMTRKIMGVIMALTFGVADLAWEVLLEIVRASVRIFLTVVSVVGFWWLQATNPWVLKKNEKEASD